MATSEVEPASPMDKDRPASQNDTVLNCESQPDFAVICSFFFKFGSALGLTYGIDELKEWLEDTRQISDELIDLHIKLLRKWKKYINKDKWEMTLVKYMLQYSNVDAWELELRGYSSIKLSIKIEVLKRLLETQFDHNTKFKTEVNALDSSSLRLLPIGRDVSGNQYWYQLDSDANIRVYREETDDEKSWSLVSKNKEDLSQLITHLETHNTLQPVKEESSANASESDSESEHESTKSPEPKSEHVDPVQLELNSKIMSLVSVKVEPTEPSNDEHNRELLNLVKSEISKSNIKPCIVEATISDEQTVVNVVQQLLSRVCTQDCHETSNYSELYDKSIGTHDIASDVCSYLVNSICTLHEPEPLSSSKNDICNSIFHETPKAAEKTIVLPDATTTAIKSDDAITKPPETPEEDITKASPTTRGRGRGRGRSRGRGRGAYLSRELRELNGMKSDDEVPEEIDVPQKRQSRRIQVLQEKKSAELANKMKKEQERLEELAHKRAESTKQREEQKKRFTEQNGSTERRYKTDSDEESPEEEEEDDSDDDHSRSRSTGKRKGKKRRRRGTKGKKGGNTRPWDSSDGEDESAHESEEPEEEEEEMLKFDDNDDEFACEEIEPDSEPVILKRARTAKKAKRDSDEESGAEEEPEDDALCKRCGKGDHPEWILLCDKCDIGFHTACCLPPLMMIPDGDWFCPPCENVMLVEKLYEEMSLLEKLLEQREKEELRQQQLKILSVELEKVVETADEKVEPKLNGVSHEKRRKERKVADESNPGSSEEEEEATNSDRSDDSEFLALRSTRNRKINYRFKEYDDLINSAIRNDDYVEDIQNNAEAEPEMEETDNALKKVAVAEGENGVPAVVVESKDSDEAADKEDENSEDDYKEPVKGKKGRQKGSKKGAKKRRLNDLDSPSEDDDSDESFKGSSATEVEEGSDDDGSATEVSEEDDSDDSDVREYKRRPARSKSSGRGKKATRGKPVTKKVKKRGYRRDEFVTDSDEDDSGDGGRTRSRKATVKRKSYKEETSDDETEEEWDEKPTKKKKGKGSGSSDEEWGGKRETSGKKSKKESDDDDEGTEDDDDDDEKDEQATEGEDDDDISNDSENAPPSPPKKKSKLEPKEKEPPKKKITKEAEMRGKPRLSKARMISMKEAAEDSDETEEELPKKKKLTTTIEAVEDTDDDETSTRTEKRTDKTKEQLTPVPVNNIRNEMSKAFSTSPLIAAALTGPPGARPQLPHLLPPPPLVSGGPPMQRPHMNQGQSEPSALSQLTAFASRGPITSVSSAASPLHLPPPHSSSPYNTYSPSQQPPPPLIHGPPPPGAPDADDQEYTLTPLEPFGGKPLKPTLVSSADGPFPPTSHSTDSGSRLLNLDSGPPRHLHPGGPPMGYPHVMPYERFPSHLYGPKHGPPPPTGHPSSRPPPPGYPPDHYVSRGPPIPSHHPGFPPAHHRGYYPGTGPYPPGSHGPEVRLPPSDAYRHGRPTLFPPGHGPPPAGLPHSGVVSGHPTANYPRGIPREPMAGYYGPHPAHDVRGGGGGPPVPPPGPRQLGQPPPGHHAGVAGFGGYPPPYAFYGQPGAPNGGFMIQNLLQHPSAMAAAAAAAAAASGQASNGGIPGPPPPTTIEPVPVSSSANREQQ